ncbi:protein Skeletor, isoforms B/C isoform X3 [Anopheles funestus]|uniref:protein Skeletor, isoforms B/C isoform X3 n=1 Tax=Anopheles funestus TaxID=62324 RepID=UPI0020C5FE4A|nr:protein Skeletor, isoforms B/C isoform X3 [Anopheles funestus]
MMAAILVREKPRQTRDDDDDDDPATVSECYASNGLNGAWNRMEQALQSHERTPRLSSVCCLGSVKEEMMEQQEKQKAQDGRNCTDGRCLVEEQRSGLVANNAKGRHWPWSGSCARDTSLLVGLVLVLLHTVEVDCRAPKEPYYGREIGKLANFGHGIKGQVYAVDESTLFVKGFAYDGNAPDAFFWVGNSPRPSPEGYIIPYPEEYSGREPPVLQQHNNTDIILKLPMGKRIRDIQWLSVWCRRFTVDFGEIFIPPGLDVPKPRVLPEFKRLAHGLRSSNISILDAKTFYIPNLHYDGAGPDAYFWVGNGSEPNIMGTKVPNEIGSLEPLRGYQGEDIEIQLPGNLTVYDIDWLAVWCVEYRHNFGHVYIPKDLDVPPALGQTKIAPPWWYKPTTTTTSSVITQATSKPANINCKELLRGKLNVMWEVMDDYIVIELIGRIREDQYMAFGISGSHGHPQMIGADVVVAFYDRRQRRFRAEDYYMSSLSQCDGKLGVCPDERIGGKNDVEILSGDRSHGVTKIKYRRLLQTNEAVNDRAYPLDRQISVIAAIGPLNSRDEANAHSHTGTEVTVDDVQIDFASKNDHTCTDALDNYRDENDPEPWPVRTILGEKTITARIGPTGGKRGYTPLTGHPSWGIAWYMNDMLIPEIYVERGQTYTFIVEGGDEMTQPAKYHPLYITSSSEGGYGQLSEAKRRRETVYAGVEYDADGYAYPTGAGRYCEWKHKTIDRSAEIATFDEYKKTLQLSCDDPNGQPAYLNWTVVDETPDLVYYQCFTHRNLGWKIHVVNPGETSKISGSHGLYGSGSSTLLYALLVLALTPSWWLILMQLSRGF